MRVCEYESSYGNNRYRIFPTTELLIICVVIAIAIGLFYISGYTPKAKVDNTEYVE